MRMGRLSAASSHDVIPAKARIPFLLMNQREIPAFAGMSRWLGGGEISYDPDLSSISLM